MEFTTNGLFCCVSANCIGLQEFHLEKKVTVLESANKNLLKLHGGILKIKSAKYLDVSSSAAKYVPLKFIWFYDLLISDNLNNNDVQLL